MSWKKIAFFVEGYTEQAFVQNLLIEIFGAKRIAIEIESIKGGNKVATSFTAIKSPITAETTKYYALIYNCNGDGSVKSYILEQRDGLIKAGYQKVIGLRDIYPDFERSEINQLRMEMNRKMPQKDLPVSFVFSIMEIESWFLADELHYGNIDANLDSNSFKTQFGFSPLTDNTEEIEEAAKTLNTIYQSVGKKYSKKQKYVDRTISALDFHNIYFEVKTRNGSLNELITEFEEIFD